MTALVCPHCKSLANFSLVWRSGDQAVQSPTHANAAFQCNNTLCRKVVGGWVIIGTESSVGDYWPREVGGKDFPDVPQSIAEAANEAHQCLSIDANRAAIGVARAVVEATAKEKGVTSGSLEAKIDKLVENGVLGKDTGDAAHAVRLWGNDAAHGDLALEAFERADAEEIVALMDEILLRAYQSPARTARIIASRDARKRGQPGGVPDVESS